MPAVSVVIATFNRLSYVRQAVDSILEQRISDLEVIVVDDASTDGTDAAIRERYGERVRYIRHDRQLGSSEARNTGIAASCAEFIAFQDSDDASYPGRLEAQIAALSEDPELVIVGGQIDWYDPDLKQVLERPQVLAPSDFEIRFNSLFIQPVCFPASMVRAEVVRRHDIKLNPDYPPAEDYDFVLRLLRLGRARNLTQPVLKYRRHFGQISSLGNRRLLEVHAQLSHARLKQVGIELDPETRRALEHVIANPVSPDRERSVNPPDKEGLFLLVQSFRYLIQIADFLARAEEPRPGELDALKASLRHRCLANIAL